MTPAWVVFLIVGLSGWAVIGDVLLKKAGAGTTNYWLFVAGMLIYASSALGWFYAFKHIKLSTLGAIYAVATVLLLVLVGMFLFKERLTEWEVFGVGMAIASVILLARFA